ncbi:hypothetical protein ADUPG1_010521, partial [Aduncisulcus paluster]
KKSLLLLPPTKDDFQAISQSTNQTIFDSSDAAITKPPVDKAFEDAFATQDDAFATQEENPKHQDELDIFDAFNQQESGNDTKEKNAEDEEKEEPFEFEFGEEIEEVKEEINECFEFEKEADRPVQETPTDPRSASKPSGVGSLDDAFSFGASESATKNPVDNTFDGAFGEAFDQIPVSNESTETGKDWFGVFDEQKPVEGSANDAFADFF